MPTPYCILAQISAEIPGQFLTQALDDDGDGLADPGVFDSVVANAQTEIDGILGQRFEVPFSNPLPAVVSRAAVVLTCYRCYARRSITDEKNPFTKQAADVRAQLKDIASGKVPLAPELKRAKPSVSVIAEPAKTSSRASRAAV